MSVQPSQSSGPSSDDGQPSDSDGRRFSTIIGSLAAATSSDEEAPANRPTFTARTSEPAVAVPAEPTDAPHGDAPPEPADTPDTGPSDTGPSDTGPSDTGPSDTGAPDTDAPGTGTSVQPETGPVSAASAALADQERTRGLRPAAAPADGPLLSDAAGFRARWQRVQADFVDDPREAVGNAADLIEQTAQALVGALRQRQRQLRMTWERGPAPAAAADGEPTTRGSDTEHLRLVMQRYRALFNELCRP